MSRLEELASPLNVLTITPFFPSDQNEVDGCFVAEPMEQFENLGIESSVIAVSSIYHRRKRSIRSAPADWVRYLQCPPGILGLSSAGKFLFRRLLPRVEKLHRAKPIDVIHAHSALPCGLAAALLSKKLNIPFVVTVHGLDVFNTCSHTGIAAAWRRQASVYVYRAARSVICVSARVQEILQARMQAGISSDVVYNGVDPTLFSPLPANAEVLPAEILVVGQLLPSKGHELVLRAVGILKSTFPLIRCTVIGEGLYRAQFEALASELRIEEDVRFAGRKSRIEVAEAMRNCTIFVLPSRNEGLGCVYLEAMSCGKPIIACRGQGIEGVIEHGENGWLIPGDAQEDLVKVLSALLASSDLRGRIGYAARQTILEKLTLSHQAQNLISVYRQSVRQKLCDPSKN
jgi:glycosyltransferase involved in cell wall biosynthesis